MKTFNNDFIETIDNKYNKGKKSKENPLKRWKRIGLLKDLPENRMEMMANSFEYLLNLLEEIEEKKPSNGDANSIAFPIIRRIGGVIDITNNDIVNIVKEINEQYKDYNTFDEKLYGDDKELAFCTEYSEKKIKELKN